MPLFFFGEPIHNCPTLGCKGYLLPSGSGRWGALIMCHHHYPECPYSSNPYVYLLNTHLVHIPNVSDLQSPLLGDLSPCSGFLNLGGPQNHPSQSYQWQNPNYLGFLPFFFPELNIYPPLNKHSHGKSPLFMGKLTSFLFYGHVQ